MNNYFKLQLEALKVAIFALCLEAAGSRAQTFQRNWESKRIPLTKTNSIAKHQQKQHKSLRPPTVIKGKKDGRHTGMPKRREEYRVSKKVRLARGWRLLQHLFLFSVQAKEGRGCRKAALSCRRAISSRHLLMRLDGWLMSSTVRREQREAKVRNFTAQM